MVENEELKSRTITEDLARTNATQRVVDQWEKTDAGVCVIRERLVYSQDTVMDGAWIQQAEIWATKYTSECGEYIDALRDANGVLILDENGDIIYPAPAGAYDLSYLVYDSGADLDVSAQGDLMSHFIFSTDGTKMYLLSWTNETIYQYTLGTPYDPATLSYDSKSLTVTSQITQQPRGILFNSDGTRFYIMSDYFRDTYQYNVSTPWDISTAVYFGSKDMQSADASIMDLFMNPDDSKFYLYSINADGFYEWTITPPGEVSTLVYTEKWYDQPAAEGEDGRSMVISPDGLHLHASDNEGKVNQYAMTIAWDISTCVWEKELVFSPRASAIRWTEDGTVLYALDANTPSVMRKFNIVVP
jgi:hypothetical protein